MRVPHLVRGIFRSDLNLPFALQPVRPRGPGRASRPPRLIEVFQVGRSLALAGRHQEALGAEEVIVTADNDMRVILPADPFAPFRLRV